MGCNEWRRFPGFLLACAWASTHAQTIGDYSHSQALLLERNMALAIGRPIVAGSLAAAPTLAASTSTSVSNRATSGESKAMASSIDSNLPSINGMVSSGGKALAEVSVDGVPYWVAAGEAIPHTAWRLRSIEVGRVELQRTSMKSGHDRSAIESRSRLVTLPSDNQARP
jgi:hypothetical protein